MTDLQVSLLVIGVIVVAAVIGYNWLQQWRLKRRLERSFEDDRADVLLRERETAREAHPGGRLEPQLGAPGEAAGTDAHGAPMAGTLPERGDAASETPLVEPAAAPLPPVPGFDPEIDYLVEIDAAQPISAAGLADLHARAAACGRRFRVVGFDTQLGMWQEAGRLSGRRYAHLRLALQLVGRKGPVDATALYTFCAAAQECAERHGARAACPDVETAIERAGEIDRFCAEVDVAIGVNVVASGNEKFAGPRIRSLAESLSFQLEPDGVFHYLDEGHRTLFTLDNHEPTPFLPEHIQEITTGGITLLLDVPRVPDGSAALDTMLRFGRELASGLGGTLVDDNRVPLTDAAVRAIKQQLASIHASMDARSTPPGSERALRLFS